MVYRLIETKAAVQTPTIDVRSKDTIAPVDQTILQDRFNRTISYLRLSITDRCDLRCTYCMPERMQFLPKSDVLSFEELTRLVDAFIARGITKLRVTGGEPLVRKDAIRLLSKFAERLGSGLEELTLTTNATQLEANAQALADMGIKRINISLDSLDRNVYERLSRRDALPQVLRGIDAAAKSGLKVKINTVALADANADEIPSMISWAHKNGFDLSLIEVMPLGEEMTHRSSSFLSLQEVKSQLNKHWTLTELEDSTGGPARYMRVEETGGRVGFISPLSHNFCATCNRIRMTCTGRLYTCLGHEEGEDLRAALRDDQTDETMNRLLNRALRNKPERHDFDEAKIDTPSSPRTMSVTGG
ncbi:GTP 3',8-cyclase MoaA [Hirschia baltica]|uniref:GTP 3',8-cyclase n=1 Tax=Hirschia baltica (strain ATCC 49814 / DSM 5838 / IFAM 1418) TaxID=582402 RepID=C6XJ27_HIRBI|nr:GTP 3',8-cyclase MoaA [Hirschia baltica]ACT59122.1 molybdenum cofactor biosynthesis protein A [Hirschia baltica ATCC 49814]